jgi:methylated-DNA-[protein]-cysteine S-methyltransferase
MLYSATYQSPLKELFLVADGDSLVGVWFEGQKHFGGGVAEQISEKANLPILVKAKKWLDRYFSKKKPDIAELPLAPQGGEFRQEVWRLLREIPHGRVVTYGDLAKKVAARLNKERMSAQAVGGAVGHNPISVIIPCHRVVGANGHLTGYAGGIWRKKQLLEIEGLDVSKLTQNAS